MQKYYHLQAYELLAVLCSSDHKAFDFSQNILRDLAVEFDTYYTGSDFQTLFEKAKSAWANHEITEDALFIQYEALSLDFSNQDILSLKERQIMYTCIQGWILEYGLPADLSALALRSLSIDEKIVRSLNAFLADDWSEEDIGENKIIQLEPQSKSGDSLDGNWIKSNLPREIIEKGVHYIEKLDFPVKLLFVDSLKIFFVLCREKGIRISKNGASSMCNWEFVEPGDSIEINDRVNFDYYDLKRRYLIIFEVEKLTLRARDISHTHAPGKSIKHLNLRIDSGTLVGLLGREGSGKSTLLDLLAGEMISSTGDISINGYSYQKELYHLKGMIGYVPEEDMLFNELTVYDNLYYSARLYLGNLNEKEIARQVKQLLIDLNLWSLADRVVGTSQDKNMQPGQRRLLNIALELIRDPKILIVDNAIAPLSLSDSSRIIEVLSAYTFKGRIVVTSITQTEKQIFQYFDRLILLDEGGVPILYTKISEAWTLLHLAMGLPRKTSDRPGPNDILELIHQPVVIKGRSSSERYRSSEELYNILNADLKKHKDPLESDRKILPKNILQPPTLERQYVIFNLRNFKTKLSRTRELLVTLVSAPLLALLLSIVLRESSKSGYSFHDNYNIPVFFFVSFLIAIFLGLVLSAREVFRERRIIQKQTYLNISKFSYINSKITYLFIISIVQSFLFIIISHSLLQIRGMLWMHWLIYFSCQSFGLLTGLVLSESHRTLDSIYSRAIPIILLLQLLFGGGVISLDTLSNQKRYTPLVADLAVTRWAHEAMMVYQFRHNAYTEIFYSYDREYSSGRLNAYYFIPLIRDQLDYCMVNLESNPDSVGDLLNSVRQQLKKFPKHFDIFPYENVDSLTLKDFNEAIATDLGDYLEYINLFFYGLYENAGESRDAYERSLNDSLGQEYLVKLNKEHTNRAVIRDVTNASLNTVIDMGTLPPIQLINQIYQYPDSEYGRTQFYLPEKSVNGQIIDTVEFDISIIWLFNLFLYIILLTSLLSIAGTDKQDL